MISLLNIRYSSFFFLFFSFSFSPLPLPLVKEFTRLPESIKFSFNDDDEFEFLRLPFTAASLQNSTQRGVQPPENVSILLLRLLHLCYYYLLLNFCPTFLFSATNLPHIFLTHYLIVISILY